jgi:disulfide bond formation protein DsbB
MYRLEPKWTPTRLINFGGFLACVALLSGAYYLQFVQHLEPCPLCIFQRLAMFPLGILFLLAAVQNPKGWGRRVYGVLIVIAAAVGIAVASRHIWIQSLPADQVPACGPGLDYLMNNFPLLQAVKVVLQGSGECAEVQKVFGLSIPIWSLAAFVLLGAAGVVANFTGKPGPRRIFA